MKCSGGYVSPWSGVGGRDWKMRRVIISSRKVHEDQRGIKPCSVRVIVAVPHAIQVCSMVVRTSASAHREHENATTVDFGYISVLAQS